MPSNVSSTDPGVFACAVAFESKAAISEADKANNIILVDAHLTYRYVFTGNIQGKNHSWSQAKSHTLLSNAVELSTKSKYILCTQITQNGPATATRRTPTWRGAAILC